jgi:hypothetical protein
VTPIAIVYVALVSSLDGERVAVVEGPTGPQPLIVPQRAEVDPAGMLNELRLVISQDPTFIGKLVTIAQFSARADVAIYDRRGEARAHPRVSSPFGG